MPENPEEPSTSAPPPPDIKKGPPPAPAPSALDRSAGETPAPALKVSVSSDDGDGDAGEPASHGSEASLQDRVIAAAIDGVLATGVWIAVVMVMPGFLERLGALLAFGYVLTRDSLPFLGGQSVGKKAVRIQAVTTDRNTLAGNWKPGIIRNAVLLIPLFPLVELFVLISRQDKPGPATRLGDEWAGTQVINIETPVTAEAPAVPDPPPEPDPSGDESPD